MLSNGTMMRMQDQTLSKVLKHDALNILSETLVLASMLYWADEQCTAQNLLPGPVNRRKIIDQRLYLVRFGIMSGKEFANCLKMVGNTFFSDREVSEIMTCIANGANELSISTYLVYKRRPTFYRPPATALNTVEIENGFSPPCWLINLCGTISTLLCFYWDVAGVYSIIGLYFFSKCLRSLSCCS